MVEATSPVSTEETTEYGYSKGFTVPDETNLHRTLNISAPYGRYRTRMLRTVEGIRAIGPNDEELGEEKEVVMPAARPEESVKRIEMAGKQYEALKLKYSKLAERIAQGESANFESDHESEEEKKEGASGGSFEDEDEKDDARKEEFEKKRKQKTKAQIEKEALEGDLYGALEMYDVTYDATEKMITKAYRKMAIKYHPDKLGDKLTERDKEVWLKIQEAYETLTDPAKKRKYDSSLPFDEKIPEEGTFTEENFYEVFTKCFTLNARWSTKQPTPNFGNEHMPLPNVKKFYKFWNDFQTWREFSQYDEYDTNEAQDRFERRYMEQENKRCRAKYNKKERARIMRLVENAYNSDPRIQKELREIEAEKQRIKEEYKQKKLAAAKAKEDAIQKRKDEAEAIEKAKQEEVKAAADAKKVADLAYKQSIRELIELCTETLSGSNYDRFWVEGNQRKLFQTKEKTDAFAAHLRELQAREDVDQAGKIELWKVHVTEMSQSAAERAAAKAAEEEKKNKVAAVEDSNWSKDDIAMLTKAIVKFPPGTGSRWKVIAEFCGMRNQKEVIKKAQELAQRRQNELE